MNGSVPDDHASLGGTVGRTYLRADMGIWTEAETNPDADGHEI
jgi:hypothetical protein